MQNLQQKEEALVNLAPAIVAMVIDPYRVVINKGAQDGIKFAQRFTVYELSAEDVVDPTTMESLGRLETIKGTGTVVHIQDKMAILEGINENPFLGLLVSTPKTAFKDQGWRQGETYLIRKIMSNRTDWNDFRIEEPSDVA